MTRLLSLVPALFLAACFGSHGMDDGPSDDAPRIDAGTRPADGGPRPGWDGGHRPDAGPVWDGGRSDCDGRRADVSCGTAPYPSGVPFELPVSIGGDGDCYCGETVSCAVSVRPGPMGEPVDIELSTAVCHGGALCDACFPYIEGACAIPALPGGRYPVWIDGERAFDLHVEEGDFVGEQQCTTSAEPDPLGCGPVSWPPDRYEVGEVCHPGSISPGPRATIRVVDQCASCGQQPGPCTVTLDESGFAPVLRVDATRTYSACDVDCPDVCMRMEQRCAVPAGLPYGRYQVLVNGRSFGTWLEITDTPTFEEVCAGAVGG